MTINFYQTLEDLQHYDDANILYLITEDIDIKKIQEHSKGIICGAVVPHIIAEGKLNHSGILKMSFSAEENSKFHLIDMSTEFKAVEFRNDTTLFMFGDSLSSYFESFVEELDSNISTQTLFGSGIGNSSFDLKDNIFDNTHVYKNSTLVVELTSQINIGIKHGWKPVYGPLVVTKTEENIIYEINNEPAFEIYSKILMDIGDQSINKDNFFDIAKAYPFGIMTYTENEFIIRDPLGANDDNALLMVSSIAEKETIYIMNGNHNSLVDAAKLNAEETIDAKNANNIVFDCISRVMYMDDKFDDEMNALMSATGSKVPLYGITSIGELTNYGFEKINIFNKTNLIGTIKNA